MAFSLERVVPWGRSFDEYVGMFALSETDLQGRILGCGDGPASFNAESTARTGAANGRVVSVDPLYRYPAEDIRRRIAETSPEVIRQTHANRHEFVWEHIRTVDELAAVRRRAMQRFLDDFSRPDRQGRYLAAGLPDLPFADGVFDLAVCSHFLFLYSDQCSLAFHLTALRELLRVAGEVRVFPLLELGSRPSRHLSAVIERLRAEGLAPEQVEVPYEFQRGGNHMLRLRNPRLAGGVA